MRMSLGGIGLLCWAVASPGNAQTCVTLRGQWSLGLSVGVSSYSGVTEGIGPQGESVGFAPYRPTMWGIALTRGNERFRVGVTARYGQAGLGIRGVPPAEEGPASGLLVIAENAYHVAAFTGGISTRLLRLRGGPALRPSLALNLERWTAPGTPARTIAGGQAGLALEVVLTGALVGSLEGEVGFTPASPFQAADLPEGYRLRSAWRRTLAGAVSWRF
jgi:hypothetical protein